MNGIRYGVGNLDVWLQFGIAVGFGAGGITLMACVECGEQIVVQPGDRIAGGVQLGELLRHVSVCPPRKKPAPPEGPLFGVIVDRGKYKFLTAGPEVNNDDSDDAA